MAFEIGECKPEEYIQCELDRVREGDLEAGSRYTWMLALTSGPYKMPVRIEEEPILQDKTSGIYVVRNTLLDRRGRPLGETRNHIFHDGYYMREERHDLARLGEFLVDTSAAYPEGVYTGYFRDDYATNPSHPAEEAGAEAEIPPEASQRDEELQPVAA